MKPETPSWLADPEAGTLSSPIKGPPPPTAAPPPTGIAREPKDAEQHLGWWILFMRVINMATMICLGVAAVFAMTLTVDVDSIILGVYGVLFATLVFCFETQLWFIRKRISTSFGFLFNPIFRTLFYGMMAAVAWSYNSTMGLVSAIATIVCAALNFYVLCRFPSYREERNKLAEEEDAKINERMNEEIKKRAMAGLRAGS
ncbi:hypothetical protein TrST_g12772 [Triparma strigata]|uniref:Golgi apparatus membrane protein TVP15 n=1 Tax=Triparma strigata TaxID=1606541 RepID=A0A9W6ZWW6_9STRA|nr:hypothetical protein TrST_g12772 [Triparma strigata]